MGCVPRCHPVRAKVANLSSGQYYDELYHWWERLVTTLKEAGIPPAGDFPQVFINDGSIILSLQNTDTGLHFAWHRMVSFRWEVTCYLT